MTTMGRAGALVEWMTDQRQSLEHRVSSLVREEIISPEGVEWTVHIEYREDSFERYYEWRVELADGRFVRGAEVHGPLLFWPSEAELTTMARALIAESGI